MPEWDMAPKELSQLSPSTRSDRNIVQTLKVTIEVDRSSQNTSGLWNLLDYGGGDLLDPNTPEPLCTQLLCPKKIVDFLNMYQLGGGGHTSIGDTQTFLALRCSRCKLVLEEASC